MVSAPATDFFQVLGVEHRFDLDTGEIEKRYRELSKEVHPDRHVDEGARERVGALQATMQLNEAVKTLRQPQARAEHLLALRGVVIGENERIEPELIMDVLEAREELAEAMAASDRDRLDELEEAMLDRRDELLARVGELFAAVDRGESPPDAGFQAIKRQLILLRYVDRYLEQLDEADDAGDGASL